MPETGTIIIELTRDEANAILEGADDLVTSSGTTNLLAAVRAKLNNALFEVEPNIPDHPPPLDFTKQGDKTTNVHFTAQPVTSQGETS